MLIENCIKSQINSCFRKYISDQFLKWIINIITFYHFIQLNKVTLNFEYILFNNFFIIQNVDNYKPSHCSLFIQVQQLIYNVHFHSKNKEIEKFNNQFSFYGLVLKSNGERIIKFLTILIIWRRFCSLKQSELEQPLLLEELLKEQLCSKFKALIMKNTKEQIISKVKSLIKAFVITSKADYYNSNSLKVLDFLEKQKISSFQLIHNLDEELIQQDLPPNYLERALTYVINQKDFINKYVNNKINEIIQEIKINHQIVFKKILSQNIQFLTINVIKMISEIGDDQKAQDYFNEENNLDEETSQGQLLDIALTSLQGRFSAFSSLLKERYQKIFHFSNYQKTDFFVFFYDQNNETSCLIQDLKLFLIEMQKQLEYFSIEENSMIDFVRFQVHQKIDEVRSYMAGCQEICPFCKRKCDETCLFEDENHIHACKNGHQIRGINKISIQGTPSLFTCEEITNQDQIFLLDSNVLHSWKDLKHKWNWNFNTLDKQKKTQNILKMQRLWNNGLGLKICSTLGIFYEKRELEWRKHQIYEEQIHYIVAIEHSFAMRGIKWEICRKSTTDLIQKTQANYNSRISVILYHQIAQLVIDCEKMDYHKLQNNMEMREYKLVNIELVFEQIIKQISLKGNQNFLKYYLIYLRTIVIIHTEQIKNIPEEQIEKISQLAKSQGNLLFKFYSLVEFDSNLEVIVQKMRQQQIGVEWYKYDHSTFTNEQKSEKMELRNNFEQTI